VAKRNQAGKKAGWSAFEGYLDEVGEGDIA
jgi:hypothetical protein